jgi:ABC-type branched-subunit amino acid transport system ATPase component
VASSATGAGGAESPVLLEITGLRKHFSGIRAVDGLTFDVRRGELLGVIGPNGAGKTTLFNLVTGVLRPDAGDIRLAGRSLVGLPPHRIARLAIARTFQRNRSFPSLTVQENVALAGHHGCAGRAPRERLADALALFDLEAWRDRYPSELPFGVLRRLELARAYARGPSLVLLDEPAAGMNLEEIGWLAGVLRELVRRGITVVLIEHAMDLVLPISDRVVVLDHGRKIAEGTPAEIVADATTIEAYLGTPVARA